MKYFIFLLILFPIACTSQSAKEKHNVTAAKPREASKAWLGKWERVKWANDATLEILSVKEDSIHFNLSASSGGHTGGLDDVYAMVVNNKAVYTYKDEYDDCLVEFTLQGDSVIIVEQKTGVCFTAMGVTFSGQYKNSELLTTQSQKEETLLSLGIFKNKIQDSIFHALVGEDYTLFLNSSQLVSEEEDIDQLNATVTAGGVRGLFTIMENIIIMDADHHIWAAAIDDQTVVYYTNSSEYASSLPKTIDKWRENFKEYKVIYKSER